MSKELKESQEVLAEAYYRAVARISELEAENKALREALSSIVSLDNTWADPLGRVKRIAEQALKQK